MINISEIIIVEGKHDKVKLSNFIDGTIIETGGFRIFKDKPKQKMIRDLGNKNGVIILTDSDSAGFVIRNFLKTILPENKIKNAYIPEVFGKEKRKDTVSKEGLVGVEGMTKQIILDALSSDISNEKRENFLTKLDFYEDGLSGGHDSEALRQQLLTKLGLPKFLSANALLEYINCSLDFETYKSYIFDIKKGL